MNGTARSVALGARVAGAIVALGFLLGVVGGPLVPVVGGLALMTFGHGLVLDRRARAFCASGLAVVAGAMGVGALRWGAMGLQAIRGAQQVLGPTVLVGPEAAAVASWVAAVAAVLGLATWIASTYPDRWAPRAAWAAEAAIGSLAVVWVFWGGAHGTGGAGLSGAELAQWAGAVVAATGCSVATALLVTRLGPRWRWAIPAVAAIGVASAAGLIASVV